MTRKGWYTFAGLCVVLVALTVHIGGIAMGRSSQAASSYNSRAVTVASVRGTIYDRAMRPFVNETSVYYAALSPDERLLAHIRGAAEPASLEAVMAQLQRGTPAAVRLTQPVGLADGLCLFRVPVRYTNRLLAPHVLGYLDAGGTGGVIGIEKAYDTVLNRYRGTAVASFSVDGNGTCLSGIQPTVKDTTALAKGGVVLTLDKDIQQTVEDLAPEYLTAGAVIVMDPYTGDILAMASFPSFQPDTVAECIQAGNGALLNRALTNYDCGSVFKTITAAAALESGISPNQVYDCAGAIDIHGNILHCHNRLGHGSLTMTEAFAQSCNLYFIQLAEQSGAGVLYAMANDYGFARSITLAADLQSAKALLPDLTTLLERPAALANLSFGQGYLMATPLHIAQMTAAIVNDGVMMPARLVIGTVDEDGNMQPEETGKGSAVVSSATAATIRRMMEKVVTDGTGKKAAPANCTAAGKTGTAETGQTSDKKPVVQSWFTGYFPADQPQYVVTVLAEDANNTNAKSAELFCEICNNLFEENK